MGGSQACRRESLSKAACQSQSCVSTGALTSMSFSSLWGSLVLRKFVVESPFFQGRKAVVVSSQSDLIYARPHLIHNVPLGLFLLEYN